MGLVLCARLWSAAEMDEFNPYAPPEAGGAVGTSKSRKKAKRPVARGIAEAIERLNEHLADSNAVAHDRKEAGGRLRGATIGFIVASGLLLVATAVLMIRSKSIRWQPEEVVTSILAGFISFLTLILVAVDLQLALRDKPGTPEKTLKDFYRSVALGRLGYAWAILSPTAREQTIGPPVLGDLPITDGTFVLRSTRDLKEFTQTFVRPGNGQMRTMSIKHVTLLQEDGDVAIVEVTAQFQAWPQWAQIISVVAFVIARLVGALLYLILYFALRKTHDVTFRKTLIRGSNGVWYIYSPDWLD